MSAMARLEPTNVKHFATPGDFRAWLEAHADEGGELWLGYWKKDSGRPSVTWEDTVDEALCHGWIDGIRKRIDDEAYTIRFTPRRPDSIWSRRNIERYAVLEAEGRIRPPGREAYERRKDDRTGLYSFERDRPAELPDSYLDALRTNPAAWSDWEARPPGYKRQVTHWIMSAKRKETRDRRLGALIEDGAEGRKVKPLRRPGER